MPEGAYQEELFPDDAPGYRQSRPRQRALFPLRRITITIACEQLVIGVIVLLMLMVVTHSLGVERGRHLALADRRVAAPQPLPRALSGPTPVAGGVSSPERRAAVSPATARAAPSAVPSGVPVAPPAQATELAAIPSGGSPYTIQLVTYSRSVLAQRELAKLRGEGQGPFLIFDGKYFFICLGGFDSTAEAVRYLPVARKRYPDAFVRKR